MKGSGKKTKEQRDAAEGAAAETETSSDDVTAAHVPPAPPPRCSWSSAFAAAAQLKPAEGMDDDDFKPSKCKADKGLAKISEIAAAAAASLHKSGIEQADKQHDAWLKRDESACEGSSNDCFRKNAGTVNEASSETRPQKRKRHRDDSDDSTLSHERDDQPAPLEGRMVSHPHKSEDQVMVLIDAKRQVVYDGMKRTSIGDHVIVGSVKRGEICWHDSAFQDEEAGNSTQHQAGPGSFPFPTDADDHCESPLESYRDIRLLLEKLCRGNKTDFTIYDPYYCNGAVKRNLAELGFPNVYNEMVDCYRAWSTGVGYPPDFCVLITNPPYSSNHIPQLLRHVTSSKFGNRPWFLLLPTWVHKKDYYHECTASLKPFYLVPKKRYTYLPPKQFREKKASDVHRKSSPFVSMWYIWGGSHEVNEELIRHYHAKDDGSCDLVRSKSALRDLRRKGKRKK